MLPGRIVYVIPIVISVALVCFLLVHITPGDPLVAICRRTRRRNWRRNCASPTV